jgi:surface protein
MLFKVSKKFVYSFLLILFTISAKGQFITTWRTNNPGSSASNQISIQTAGPGIFYNVSWVEVGNPANSGSVTNINTPFRTITFPNPGTYRVTMTGTYPRIVFGGNPDVRKLLTVEQWGTNAWTSMWSAFEGCSNLVINATDNPNLSNVTSLQQMFAGATSLTGNFDNWNVTTITNFSFMFFMASSFNSNISGWNVSNATDMTAMFDGASSFNQTISSWNVSNVTNMRSMFRRTNVFNQPLASWDVRNVTDMSAMFNQALVFNQPLNTWDVSQVSNMALMFEGATAFNGNITTWNVGSVTNMWNMFSGAVVFNQDLNAWDVSACISFQFMFSNAIAFNGNIADWKLSSAQYLYNMFAGASSFNRNISAWNVSGVLFMDFMFSQATSFNQNIGGWNVSSVTDMSNMFNGASTFNQNLSSWNVSQVTNMTNMFSNSGLSNTNYDNLLIGWAASSILQNNVTLGAPDNSYCLGETARNNLVSTYNWTIIDAGKSCIPVPVITSFTPTLAASGTTVTIIGTGLTGATAVAFGGTDATSFTVVSATTITAVLANGSSGNVNVITPGGTATLAGFTFIPAPTITSFTPQIATAGATVTITGTNFNGVSDVTFGGTKAASFNLISSTTITAVVADGTSGSVSVTASGGTASGNGFTFEVPKFVVKSEDNPNAPIQNNQNQAVDLGETAVNEQLTRVLSVENLGLAVINLNAVTVNNSVFTVLEFPSTINPGTSGNVTIALQSQIPATYTAKVSLDFGSSVFEFNVTGEVSFPEIEVFNVVSPNGDGAHDFLRIKHIDLYPSNMVIIINSLGDEVYRISGYSNVNKEKQFIGQSNKGNGAQTLIDGTYYYIIDIGKKEKYTGFLLLQR